MQLVLIAGYRCSGKGTAKSIFEIHGYNCLDISDDILRKEAERFGWDGKTEGLFSVRGWLGNSYMMNKIKERIGDSPLACVTSLRDIALYEKIRFHYDNAKLLWIESNTETRFERLKGRKREGDMKTLKEFTEFEAKEEQQYRTSELRGIADHVVLNDSLFSFQNQIDELAKYYKYLQIFNEKGFA